MPGRGEVRTDGDAHRPVLAPVQPHRERQPRGVAVGGDDQRGVEGDGRLLLAHPGVDAGDPAGARVHDRRADVAALVQPGPGLLRLPGQLLVEVVALADESVVRVAGQIGPVELEPYAAADDPQALVAQPAGLLGDVDAHPDELLGGARGQTVAAHLLARERGLLQEQDVQSRLGQVVRRGGAGRARPHDDDVRGVFGAGLGHGGISRRLVGLGWRVRSWRTDGGECSALDRYRYGRRCRCRCGSSLGVGPGRRVEGLSRRAMSPGTR